MCGLSRGKPVACGVQLSAAATAPGNDSGGLEDFALVDLHRVFYCVGSVVVSPERGPKTPGKVYVTISQRHLDANGQ